MSEGESARNPTVDVVDDLLSIGPALQAAIALGHTRIDLRTVASSWAQYATRIENVAQFVVVRAELVDHVPTVLKVRALRTAGARPVVVANRPAAAHRARLFDAGAEAVLAREDDLADLLEAFRRPPGPSGRDLLPGMSDAHLSDRQLQLACLFAGHGAPSSELLARSLGLPISSVRTNLQRARRALGAADRDELRSRLIEDGWLDAR